MRRWRKREGDLKLLDLRRAYLQLHVDPELWKHQVVSFKGKHYYLTRLGFGLNCAPRIMSRILDAVLSQDATVRAGTDNYLDDILVDEKIVSTNTVTNLLNRYGLEAKPAEALHDGAKVLGLLVSGSSNGILEWKRANPSPDPSCVGSTLSRRELFSICGQLVGHYPIAVRLRVTCGYLKRISEGSRWEDDVGDGARNMLKELLGELKYADPVEGVWRADSSRGRVWCDASSLAVGCALEIGGRIVEDAAWLRKKEDGAHINMAELDSVLRGVNLAVKWNLEELEIVTDSATVFGWLKSILLSTHMIRTRGMNEMLVRRRLSVLKELCSEYNLKVTVVWTASSKNKADILTRVSSKWLQAQKQKETVTTPACVAAAANEEENQVRRIHERHHLGIDRTFYMVNKEFPTIS